ncbi:DNA polymerase I [Candidatus Paraluminiphilus aquimaris]|uniref:DNA polymerase I n=1 Tax=Candidatus Paraluminiphilus aquimaris TaxID=2518994 RepID=A0ABY6Q401_9GAMM|nr:DNA polymerase I [Candidatus Paraluminiphilus aquimaris]UZP73749.1 DNA polymerase I [Candidatus Paraluminiphilus aquimaris]
MTDASRLILVDGSSYLFRAFHALPPLTNSKGMNTGAAKGVIGMLKRLQADNPADQLVVIFDAKGPTFRNDIYSEYKANRPPMPEELREQIEPIHNVIRAMGLPLISISGVEADDVIGTLSVMAAAQRRHVLISTGDKDMAQLVNDYVTLVNTMTQTVLDRDGVIEKFGVPPELIIDLLALMGDSVDNIPGVAGVGEKTALALLQNLGGVSDIYTNLDRVPELPVRGAKSLGDKLLVSQEMAELSYVLATIKTDCDLELTDADLISSAQDSERLIELYRDLEFKAWLDELLSPGLFAEAAPEAVAVSKPELTTVTITQQSVLDEWISRLKDAPLFAFDTETTSLNYMQAEIVGVSFAVEPGEAAYVPLAHINPGLEGQLNREQVLEQLRPLLESDAIKKVGQHLKYDANVLANHGISLRGIAHDTMLESYVLDAVGSRHDMGSLALKYLGQRVISFEEVAGKGAKQITFDHVPIEQAAEYAAEDADVTLRLHEALMPRLEAEPKLREVYEDLELPLVPVLSKIERNGAYVSVDRLRKQSGEIATRLAELETKACELAGQPFNLASPKQLGEILFEKLELPVIKKTPKGAPSTAEEVLVELANDYELPAVLIEHRGLAKLKSTYTDKLPEMVDAATGRVHTSYHQAVTATGRLSSSDPNLQNIPVRTEEGRRIRQAFIAPMGRKIVAADYSQIELRIMAHLSSDAGLLHAFAHELDVHSATAAEVFDVALEAVNNDQRRKAKAINFGLIYGMSAFGLAKQIGVSRSEAQQYIDRYFARYPGVADYMDATRALAHEQGYVETLLGRRLYLPEINARNKQRQLAAERTAINAPMQGTAADIIKLAMIEVDRWLTDSALDAKMIMQVHDELVFEVADEACDALCAEVTARMANVIELKVPLLTEVGVGANWDEAH